MAWIGFFVQMVIPARLDAEVVKGAALALAATEDGEYEMHPERLFRLIPLSAAQACQNRLQEMDEGQRLADRNLLLD